MAAEVMSKMMELAEVTRPRPDSPSVPVLGLAASLGVKVTLRGSAGARETHARLAYSSPPEIAVYRSGTLEFRKCLGPSEERILRPRERFSVAHELGHWLARRDLGIEPVSDGRAYWEQEALMNEFAQTLLVPPSLVDGWLRRSAVGSIVHPMQLRRWAESCLVSEDVIASALCRVRPEMGILRMEVMSKMRGGTRLMKVRFSVGGANLSLPRVHTQVGDAALLKLLASRELGFAQDVLITIRDRRKIRVSLAWRRADSKSKKLGPSYRLVVAPPGDPSTRQLELPV